MDYMLHLCRSLSERGKLTCLPSRLVSVAGKQNPFYMN